MRKNKKARKRNLEAGTQKTPKKEPSAQQALPAWAIVTEEEKEAARRDLQRMTSGNSVVSQQSSVIPPALPPRRT